MTEINDCPFCKSSEVLLTGTRYYWVMCNSCRAHGPMNTNSKKAVNLWNSVTDDIDGLTFNERALRKDCERLRKELDEAKGVVR